MDPELWALTTVCFLLCTLALYYLWFVHPKTSCEIPGPEVTSYMFGNLSEISKDKDTLHRLLAKFGIQYGEVFRLFFGQQMSVCLQNVADIRHITVTRNYPKSNVLRAEFGSFSPKALVVADPDDHPYQRSAICKMFNASFLPTVYKHLSTEVHVLVNKFDNAAKNHWSLDLDACLVACLFDTIGRLTVGKTLNTQSGESEVSKAMFNSVDELFTNIIYYPFREWIPGSQKKFKENLKILHGFIYDVIDERCNESAHDSEKRELKDLLDVFLSIPGNKKDQTLGHVVGFFFAGHDTTAHTMAFLALEVCKKPEIERRMADEIAQVCGDLTGDNFHFPSTEKLAELKYCNWVWQETLRMYPAAAIGTSRQLNRDDVLPSRGYKLKKGTRVFVSPFAIHHNPKYWDDPEEFIPERFSPEQVKSKRARDREFLPFLMGPRNCVGSFVARAEAISLIAVMYGRYSFKLDCGFEDVKEFYMNTLRPRTFSEDGKPPVGLPVKVIRRTNPPKDRDKSTVCTLSDAP